MTFRTAAVLALIALNPAGQQAPIDEVKSTLSALDATIARNPGDVSALISRGRLVLDNAYRLESIFSVPALCDRAIADFSRVIAVQPGNAQAFYWRGMAFWEKVQFDGGKGSRKYPVDELRSVVADNLDQARKNLEQARFLTPQDQGIKDQLAAVEGFWNRFPAPIVGVPYVPPNRSAQDVFTKAAPAVVILTIQTKDGTSVGSGSIVSSNGLILTNRHVVDGAATIQVRFFDGRTATAGLVALHPTYDLALVRLNATVGNLPILMFDLWDQKIGDDVVMLGHPRRLEWSLTAGKVSQFRGSQGEPAQRVYLQTDAAANPGNSGGPILSLRGLIAAVLTMTLGNEGLAFGISKEIAEPFVRRYK